MLFVCFFQVFTDAYHVSSELLIVTLKATLGPDVLAWLIAPASDAGKPCQKIFQVFHGSNSNTLEFKGTAVLANTYLPHWYPISLWVQTEQERNRCRMALLVPVVATISVMGLNRPSTGHTNLWCLQPKSDSVTIFVF